MWQLDIGTRLFSKLFNTSVHNPRGSAPTIQTILFFFNVLFLLRSHTKWDFLFLVAYPKIVSHEVFHEAAADISGSLFCCSISCIFCIQILQKVFCLFLVSCSCIVGMPCESIWMNSFIRQHCMRYCHTLLQLDYKADMATALQFKLQLIINHSFARSFMFLVHNWNRLRGTFDFYFLATFCAMYSENKKWIFLQGYYNFTLSRETWRGEKRFISLRQKLEQIKDICISQQLILE